ncbi:MAG TPA: aspartyl protease family protein [Steroidobacteraceae bacterium]|nr:aspartyl protease family protein [Steroidobacteraceae bacterium]
MIPQPNLRAWLLAPICWLWLSAWAAQATPLAPAPAATPAPVPSVPVAGAPLPEVVVEKDEPKFVAPTRRDRIGRIWAPVMIDGKGPFRLVLDTGANHSAVIQRTADALAQPHVDEMTLVTGVTGSATVPTVRVGSMEVGELLLGPTFLPVVADVFGGAQGVLGREGLAGMRIYADFGHDRLTITRSRNQHAGYDFTVIPLRVVHDGLLMADVLVGHVRTRAIIDTGAQGTVGNEALRAALLRHPGYGVKREDIIGVTLDVQTGDNVATPPIFLGKMTLAGVRVTFGDMYLFQHWDMTHEPTLLVGMDILGSFDALVIDYRTHQLELRQRETRPDWLSRPVEPGQYKPF